MILNRGYTPEEFDELIVSIYQAAPDIVLQTQVNTGFPGETEEDFTIIASELFFHNIP